MSKTIPFENQTSIRDILTVFAMSNRLYLRKTKGHIRLSSYMTLLVPTTGFEPAHLMAPPPQDGMSTNFTTWAF